MWTYLAMIELLALRNVGTWPIWFSHVVLACAAALLCFIIYCEDPVFNGLTFERERTTGLTTEQHTLISQQKSALRSALTIEELNALLTKNKLSTKSIKPEDTKTSGIVITCEGRYQQILNFIRAVDEQNWIKSIKIVIDAEKNLAIEFVLN